MGLKRDVSLPTALSYKGGTPFLTYILHRIGGVALFIFFTMYILALSGVDIVLPVFQNWLFQIVIVAFGLFHAINGLRITILDLWPKMLEHSREAIWVQWAVFLPIFGIAVFVIMSTALGG